MGLILVAVWVFVRTVRKSSGVRTEAMRYEIRVKAAAARDLSGWFEELAVQAAGGELLLSGDLPDPLALMGVLMRLHNLNLTVLSVHQINEDGAKA